MTNPTIYCKAVAAFLLSLAWCPALGATVRTVTDLGDSGAPGQLRSLMNAAAAGQDDLADTVIRDRLPHGISLSTASVSRRLSTVTEASPDT